MTIELTMSCEQHDRWNGVSREINANRLALPSPPRSGAARSYFRCLRAAEMAAWEVTGGDYLSANILAATRGLAAEGPARS